MKAEERLIAAVREASLTLSEPGDFGARLAAVLPICVRAVEAGGGTIYLHDPVRKRLLFRHVLPEEVSALLTERDIPDDFGTAGAAFRSGTTVQRRADGQTDGANVIERETGFQVRNLLATPLLLDGEPPIGVVQLLNKADGEFDANDVAIIETIASVATLAYVNRRLLLESERASTLLGMGKVSHDIGNLAASLHATVDYAAGNFEGLRARIANEPIGAEFAPVIGAQAEAYDELRRSVDRIVGYARLISDMSAGRPLRPVRKAGDLGKAVLHAASYHESDARQRGIKLTYELAEKAPSYEFDDLYVFRIVQNLVGNGLKAAHEASHAPVPSVRVSYAHRAPESEHLIEVADTGPGMTPEQASRILRGVATSEWSRASGSGWGLRIVRELAATHDGTLEIDSELGRGSIFRVRLGTKRD